MFKTRKPDVTSVSTYSVDPSPERPGSGILTLDFTSVGPDAGGVGVVARGIALGLKQLDVEFECAVSSLQLEVWQERVPDLVDTLRPVNVALAPTSRWQAKLRKIVPRAQWAQRIVGRVRALRAKSTRKALGRGTVWLPFHRVPLASGRGIVTVHDLRVFESELESRMDQRIIEENVRTAEAVVCSWAHPYRSVLERFPEAKNKTFLIPLPVLNPGAVTARSAPSGRPLRMLFPGFVTPHKNHEVVVRALPLLGDSIAVFTGSEDGTYGEDLRSLATELGVDDRIEWHGFVSTEALENEYTRADLLVMPTRWEAASGPVYEAIARELPFVASRIPPIVSQLQALGLDAELFEWDSPEELAEAIGRTVSEYDVHIERIRDIAGPLRDRTWSDTASEYLRVFEWVGGSAPRPDDLSIG